MVSMGEGNDLPIFEDCSVLLPKKENLYSSYTCLKRRTQGKRLWEGERCNDQLSFINPLNRLSRAGTLIRLGRCMLTP